LALALNAQGNGGGIHRNRETPKIELVHEFGEAIGALAPLGKTHNF
jgi:hypothetical protein